MEKTGQAKSAKKVTKKVTSVSRAKKSEKAPVLAEEKLEVQENLESTSEPKEETIQSQTDEEIKVTENQLAQPEDENQNSSEKSSEQKPSENTEDSSDIQTEIQVSEILKNTDKDHEIEIPQEIVEEKIKYAIEKQAPKKKKKSTIINLILLLVNIIFMVFIIKSFVGDVGSVNISDIIKTQGKNLWWLVGGLGMYGVYIVMQMLMYKVLIRGVTGENRWGLSYDVGVVGKYYDNVTPFAVGGQPIQIVRLASNGISAGVSTSIPLIKMVVSNTVNTVIILGFFIFGLPRIPMHSSLNMFLLILVEILGVIGLIITVLVVVFMFLVSSGRLFTRSFVSGICRLGYKLKIVKNYRVTFKKFMNQVAEYKSSMTFLKTHKKILVKMVLLAVVESLSYASLTFFVIMALAPASEIAKTTPFVLLLICMTKYYLASMASCYIPLPGGTGLMELSFVALFMETVGRNNIVWPLLLFRFFTYYLILAHGFVHELIHIFTNIAKNNKKKKLEAIQKQE